MSVQHPTVKVETFEGPLDLLLFLIAKNKVSILDIPIADIFEQYTQYLDVLREDNIEIASDFLEMAARLVYIKTAMLLPKSEEGDQLKQELAQELMEYQVCRIAAEKLRETAAFDTFTREPSEIEVDRQYTRIHEVTILTAAFLTILGRAKRRLPPKESDFTEYVAKPIVPVAWGVYSVIKQLKRRKHASIEKLFSDCTKRDQMIAVFMALLELVKAGRVIMDNDLSLTLRENKGSEFEK
ncbi:MAG TPA: segregation/condensation protein A [Oscillospiraceae bacterium]|nr:segregation/condensation protein A [Oscillospiraceae bacterium]HPF56936.1 segregation/condensation protein A [Clostridiales bacterium]HPK35658.1 segregation/condensation protein A [Oscillospiraceae bacterium]HPR75804.1 segregation/condensation protein A [Oscillospiraceae bacterium]